MIPTTPVCCVPAAFELLSRQMQSIDSTDALLHGAIAISMHQMENVDPLAIDLILQDHVDAVRKRVRGHRPAAIMAHLHEYLFDELGFRGNTDDYYNPANSYLPAVLETHKGLPITLSLLYKLLAERLGLRCWGVGLPGHFMVAVQDDNAPVLIDPFSAGRLITPDEAHARMQEMFGPETEWSHDLLQPASNRHWLTRMLQNLLNVFGSTGHYTDVAAVLEMEMILWPEQQHLQRDLALVLARCGLSRPASIWLDHYLQGNPDDPQREQLAELRQVLES